LLAGAAFRSGAFLGAALLPVLRGFLAPAMGAAVAAGAVLGLPEPCLD
jgi:hypothetical protein